MPNCKVGSTQKLTSKDHAVVKTFYHTVDSSTDYFLTGVLTFLENMYQNIYFSVHGLQKCF